MSREIWATIGGFIALAGLMLTGHSNIRSDMNAAHEGIQNDLRQIRDLLGSVDRRTARIEGHLFGIEIAEEPALSPLGRSVPR